MASTRTVFGAVYDGEKHRRLLNHLSCQTLRKMSKLM